MIDEKLAGKLIDRLARLQPLSDRNSQTGAEQRLEARRVLASACEDEEHAKRVVRHLGRGAYAVFPDSAAIWRAADAHRIDQRVQAAARDCSRCRGTGWWYPNGAAAVATCPCRIAKTPQVEPEAAERPQGRESGGGRATVKCGPTGGVL